MITNIEEILKKLNIKEKGRYENKFYIITLKDSDDYARMYTQLNKNAVNTEYPNFGTNSANSTIKITNYYELDVDDVTYNIFLTADFDNDVYTVKIGEK